MRTSALCVPYSQTKTQLILILLDLALDAEGSVACSFGSMILNSCSAEIWKHQAH